MQWQLVIRNKVEPLVPYYAYKQAHTLAITHIQREREWGEREGEGEREGREGRREFLVAST